MESQLARLLLDKICIKHLNKNLRQCAFKKDEFGKPILENYPNLHISISHSQGYVWTAASDSPLGIDFEQIEPDFKDDLKIAFDEEDWQFVSCHPDLIFKYFSLKESYSKMIGTGFTREPSDIKICKLQDKSFTDVFKNKNKSSRFIFTLIVKDFEPINLPNFKQDFLQLPYE
jgi:4'-phosphopantetheinyl transferase